jgi:hypothetical protein
VTSSRVAPARLAAPVYIKAVRALSCASHCNRDQFAVFAGDSATVPSNALIELYERGEFRWRELLKFAQPFRSSES